MESRASEMFLRPAQLPKGEKVLRIIDFVDNIIPREDERTISDGGHTKLIVSYDPKKPKLEQVTFSQWVIANTRFFYNLMISRKLNSLEDIINYPAYTVKVMELSNRFQWPSVLKYDDEFRLLQATYGYPRSFDCNHLHTVTLLAESLRYFLDKSGKRKRLCRHLQVPLSSFLDESDKFYTG